MSFSCGSPGVSGAAVFLPLWAPHQGENSVFHLLRAPQQGENSDIVQADPDASAGHRAAVVSVKARVVVLAAIWYGQVCVHLFDNGLCKYCSRFLGQRVREWVEGIGVDAVPGFVCHISGRMVCAVL